MPCAHALPKLSGIAYTKDSCAARPVQCHALAVNSRLWQFVLSFHACVSAFEYATSRAVQVGSSRDRPGKLETLNLGAQGWPSQ